VEARNRLVNGEGVLGARGYMEDAMRARGQLPARPSAPKVDAAFAHFAHTKQRMVDLEQENEHLREQLSTLSKRATETLDKQRQQIDALYSKQKANVAPTDRRSSGVEFGGNDSVEAAVAGCGTRGGEGVSGEVLRTPVPDSCGSADQHSDAGRPSETCSEPEQRDCGSVCVE